MATISPHMELHPRLTSRLVKPQVLARTASPAGTNQEPDSDCAAVAPHRRQPSSLHSEETHRIAPSRRQNNTPRLQQETPRSRLVVLRKCEDLHIRTGGFQTIEEQSWRPRDKRRSQQRPSTAPNTSPLSLVFQ